MRAEEFRRKLGEDAERLGLERQFGDSAAPLDVRTPERRLGVAFPEPVLWLFRVVKGFTVTDPKLEVRPLAELTFAGDLLLLFAVVDGRHRLGLSDV